ncbi:hypothetical protein lerEdw1_007511 [Lerista edwardsae]|nr:hypothetical protein lerEdw1_007511 [Lerista edwardsae]
MAQGLPGPRAPGHFPASRLPLSPLADPPAVEPAFLEIRQGQGRSVTMSCRVLRAYPIRVLTFEWRLGNKLLRTGQFDAQDSTEYTVRSLLRDSYGVYNCNIINEAGAGRCSFLVTGKAFAPEFYYDTYNPLWQNRARVYAYSLEWTQMNPDAVDRILTYHLGIRQVRQAGASPGEHLALE